MSCSQCLWHCNTYPLSGKRGEPIEDRKVGRTRRARAKEGSKTFTRYEMTGYIACVVLGFNNSNDWGSMGTCLYPKLAIHSQPSSAADEEETPFISAPALIIDVSSAVRGAHVA